MERVEAIALGLKKYNTGRPCRYGHIADRNVTSGACSACLREMIDAAAVIRKESPWAIGGATPRSEAARLGLTKYNTGRPCRHGHMADRYVNSGACSVCIREMVDKGVAARKRKKKCLNELIEATTVELNLFAPDMWIQSVVDMVAQANAERFPNYQVNPENLRSVNVGGGVKRIKFRVHPDDVETLKNAAALMLSAVDVGGSK